MSSNDQPAAPDTPASPATSSPTESPAAAAAKPAGQVEASADGTPVFALVHARQNPAAPNGKLRPGPRGGMLKVGGTNPGGGRPASWIRAEMRKGLARVVQVVNKAVRTGERPNGGKMTMDDYERAGNLLGRFGVGVPIEVQASTDAPFTVVLGIIPGQPIEPLPALQPAEPEAENEPAERIKHA